MATERPVIETAKIFTGWYSLAGVLFILLGLLAIVDPATAAVGIALSVVILRSVVQARTCPPGRANRGT